MTFLRRWIILVAAMAVLATAEANPIPWPPPASMPLEDMYSTLDEIDAGGLRENFLGDYYFSSIPETVSLMKYPVPPASDGISVEMGKLSPEWVFTPSILPFIHEFQVGLGQQQWYYIFESYPTVLPEWPGIPMIAWDGPFPQKALLRVKYQHNLLQRGRDYVYFYALGTGKYFQTYQKEAISFLDISMPPSYNMHRLFLDNTPHAFAVTAEKGRTVVSVYASAQFGPFTRDIIGLVRPWWIAADANYDDKTDILDLINARNQMGKNTATDAAADDADVTGDGKVDILDLIMIRNHLGEKPDALVATPSSPDVATALPPQIRLRYKVKECGTTQPPGIPTDVIPWGRRMIVSDQIHFNCCAEYVRMTMLVDGSRVIFREKAMESAPCDCICYFPMRGVAGPFAPGTYQVEIISPTGETLLEKNVIIQ